LPAGCEPIELRAPDGSLVELDGTWIEQSRTDTDQLTFWIHTRGDCLYAVGSVEDVPEEGTRMHLGTVIHYTGTVRPDFTIEGQMVHIGPQPSLRSEVPRLSDTNFLILFADDGGIELREDRQPGVVTSGPRCVEQAFCYPPLVLVPRDAGM
jgi:hypothetical protein